ncbi:OmpA family protein [Tropicibacter alexandrii]|uniref:OmpA family protein n=1 Tax=Tropicibacter alexandrii TaxID=2267683 RepID=UPI000EF5066D|nr:OmpA family protein [Tropicibacter alexandrii]
MFHRLKPLMTAALLALPGGAMALDCAYCAGKSPTELLKLSAHLGSNALRTQIRGWLAQEYPDTAPGLTARAWVASRNGAPVDEVVALYKRAIEKDPTLTTPYINAGFELAEVKRYEESDALYLAGLPYSDGDNLLTRNIFFNLRYDGRADEANAFLDESIRKGYMPAWARDYIIGIAYQSAGQRDEAVRLYKRALDKGGDYEVLERYVDNKLRLLTAQRANRDTRLRVFYEAVDWAEANNSARAMELAAQKLHKDFRFYTDAGKYYERAFDMEPTPEKALDGYYAVVNYDYGLATRLLDKAARAFPDNYEVLRTLAYHNSVVVINEDRIRRHGADAVANAPTMETLRGALNVYVNGLEEVGDDETPVALFERHLPDVTGAARRGMLGNFIDNRIRVGDYDRAAALLDEIREFGSDLSSAWLGVREARVRNGLRLTGARDRYYAENPFLLDWERRFGESLNVSVEFASGKADLRPSGFPLLDEAAAALTGEDAEKYVFMIEGHTDSVGSDAINMPLSRDRAASVERYFIEQAGLDPARLQTQGYGPRNPRATNETQAGRQTNRRVEIRPYGNLSAPQVASAGWMNLSRVKISPDGRLLITGETPIQVWDIERNVRLHELPIGGTKEADISPNGRYLATRSSFRDATGKITYQLLVYDLRTGLLKSQVRTDFTVNNLQFGPFSERVAFTDATGYLRVLTLADNSVKTTKIDTIRGSARMLFLNDGKRILATASSRHPVSVFDADTLERIDQFRQEDWILSWVQSADGQYIAAMTNGYELHTYDAKSYRLLNRKKLPTSSFRMRAHPSKPWVMVQDAFDNDTKLVLADMRDGRVISSLRHDEPLDGNWTPDGVHFVVSHEGEMKWFEAETMTPVRTQPNLAHQGKGLTLIDGTDLAISRDTGGNSVWNLRTGRRVHRFDVPVAYGWAKLNESGSILVSVTEDGQVVTFDSATYQHDIAEDTGLNVGSISTNGDDYIVVASKPDDLQGKSRAMSTIVVLERPTLREVRRFDYDLVTEPVNGERVYRTEVKVRLSEDGLLAVTSEFEIGYKQSLNGSTLVTTYDVASGREVQRITLKERQQDIDWTDANELRVKRDNRWEVFNPRTAESLRTESPDFDFTRELADGRALTWFWDHIELDDRSITFPYNLRDVEVRDDLNLAIGMTSGNEVVFVDLRNMEKALTISTRADGEWIGYAPDGRFTASLGGTEGVYWSLGDNFLPFEALKDRYERPGLIRNKLQAIASGSAPAPEDKAPDVAADIFEAPYTVSLKSAPVVRTEAGSFTLELSVEKLKEGLPDPEIEYVLNGRRVLKSRGFEEDAFFDGNETIGLTRKFDLNPGRNVIEASLVWKNARLMTQRVEVERTSKSDVELQAAGRTLWFFGVGVSDYEISAQNLNFAHRDAEELAKLAAAQEGRLFDQVRTKILTNADATERNVRIEMNEFLKDSAPDDVVVLFLAGHGVTDDEQQLYFMTHDADLSRPYTGMSVDRFRQFLENRPINQSALMLLDICHSGAAQNEGRVVADDAVQSLTEGTGAVVFASSSGSQKSLEDESFGGGHGAFTAALLDGLRGMADQTVGNRDGFNTLQEMIVFATSEVPKLTDGRQRPTYPRIEQSLDYALTEVE